MCQLVHDPWAPKPVRYASTKDVPAVAAPVLRHRIITNYNAEADGVKPDEIVKRLIEMAVREEKD